MSLDIGLLLTPGPAKGVERRWLKDLDASLSALAPYVKSLWISDHLFWEDVPTYEAWTTMAYLAAHYPHLDIGASVLGQAYRNPGLLAKMAATLQELSGGRCILGIGAGWKQDEHDAYAFPFGTTKERLDQLVDTLEILKRLWHEPGKVTFHGKHYHIVDAICEPRPDPAPAIMVGGRGNTTIKITAQYADLWNISDTELPRFKERLAYLHEACAAIKRDPATLRVTWLGRLAPGKTEAAARELALHEGYNHYRDWKLEEAFVGTPAQIVDGVNAFASAGVDYFMFEIIGLPDPAVINMVAEEIFPHIRG